MAGIIEVLATNKGHDELKLPDNGVEAKTMVDGLLKKNYTITVQVGEGSQKTDKKVIGFDSNTSEYIVKENNGELRVPSATSKATAIAPVAGG